MPAISAGLLLYRYAPDAAGRRRLAILLAAIGYRGWFRVYSIRTLAAYAGLTGWGFLRESAGTEGEMSTGAQERTMVAGYLLWVVALAVMLLRAERRRGLAAGGAAETAA